MEAEFKRNMVALAALALSTMAVSLSWTGMKIPELAFGFKFLELLGGWSLSYYIIAEVAVMPLAGKLIDVYGMRGPLAAGVGLFLIGGSVVMFSEASTAFLAGRIVQGLGAGMIFSVSMTSVGMLLRGRAMRRMHGLMTGAFAVGSLFGFAFGCWTTFEIDAESFVPICTFLAVAGGTVAYLHLPDSKPSGSHDALGTFLITLFMVVFMLFTQLVNNEFELVSEETFAFVLVSLAILAVLLMVERRASDPIFPRADERNEIGCVLCMFLAGFCGLGIIQYLLRFLMIGMDMGVYPASAMFLIFLAGAGATSMAASATIGRTGLRRWVLAGTAIVCCGLLLASQTMTDGLVFVAASLLVMGLGLGCIVTPALGSLHSSTSRRSLGTTTSVVLSFRFVGILAGAAVYAGIVSWKMADVLASIREVLGTSSLNLLTTLMMVLRDLFVGDVYVFDDSIMLCCLAAGLLSLTILVAAYFLLKPDFGKDGTEEE